MGKIIAISNQKGGVGKTTTSVNLSAALATYGKKVLLIDLDPQGSVSASLGIDRSNLIHNMYDVFVDGLDVQQVIVKPDSASIDVLPSTVDVSGVEIKVISNPFRNFILEKALNKVKGKYDYIIIDTPPSLGLLSLNALYAADSVLIPVQCQYLALDGLTQLLNTIRIVQKNKRGNKKSLKIEGVLLTMLDRRTTAGWAVVNEVREYFKEGVFDTIIQSNVAAAVAPNYGLPVLKYQPQSSSAKNYRFLAKEVMKRNEKQHR